MPNQTQGPLSFGELYLPLTVDFHWALNTFPPLIGAADRIRNAIKEAGASLPESLRRKVLGECNLIINKSSQTLVELNMQLKQAQAAKRTD